MKSKPGATRLMTAGLLVGALALAGCDSVEERIAEHYARAVELVEEGEPAKAKLEYRNVLKLKGDHVDARLGLARILEEEGNFAGAVGHYLVAVDNDVTNVDARVRLAQYMLVTGELDRALEMSDQAYELRPEDPDVLAVRASTAYQLGNKDFAVDLASKAVESEPLHASANVVLITDRVEKGNLDEATAMTESLLQAHPDDLSLHLLKLRLLELANRQDAALAQLETIVDKFPDIATSRRALAERYSTLGRLSEAEEQLRAVVELEPGNEEAKLEVVRFLFRTQGKEAAVSELEGIIAESDRPWNMQKALADLHYGTGDRDAARAVLEGVIAADSPSAGFARVELARYALSRDDRAEAEALIDTVLESDTRNVDALAMRGALQIDRGEYEEAIETLRTGLTVQPDDVRLLLLSGRAHLLLGNDALGSDQLATATRVSEYNPTISLEYVRYLLQRGRLDGAEAVLSESARRHARNRQVLASLAEVRLRQQNWVGAEEVASRLRELQGGSDTAERILAASLSGQQRYEESAAVLKGLGTDAESRQQTMTALVRNLVAAGEMDEARDFVGRILEENPDNLNARLLEASLVQTSGEVDLAAQMFEAVMNDFPEAAEPYAIVYRQRAARGEDAAALDALETGIERTGGDPRLRLQLASIREREGAFDAALEQYEAIFEAEPNSMIAANNLASSLAEHRADDPEALERARRIALRLRGTEVPEMQDTLGWVLYLSGDYEEALEVLVPAAEALPDSVFVNYHVGMAYAANENPEKAREHLEKALGLAESQPFPHLALVEEKLSELAAN